MVLEALILPGLFGRKFSQVSEHLYMTNDISFVNFRQKLYDAYLARKRSRNIFGKIYNLLTGCKPDGLELSNAVLRSVFRVTNREIPEMILGNGYKFVVYEKALELFYEYYEVLKTYPEYQTFDEAYAQNVVRQ